MLPKGVTTYCHRMRGMKFVLLLAVSGLASMASLPGVSQTKPAAQQSVVDLPTSKQLRPGVPGLPQRLNSLPVSLAVSPDGKWVVTVNAGYGTYESEYAQSLSVVNATTGAVVDSPDLRTVVNAGQTLYSGLAFSADGHHLYGSIASLTDPEGKKKGDTGSGVVVYGFTDGVLTRERLLKIPLQQLAGGRRTKLIGEVDGDKGVPYPAGIAVVPANRVANGAVPQHERLLVSDNLSDDALLMDAVTGDIVTRFDLSETDAVPGTYPVAVAVSQDGRRGYVTLWNASEVAELDLVSGVVTRKLPLLKPAEATVAGTHPCALETSPDGRTMYVALSNRDAVAAVDVSVAKGRAAAFKVKGYFDTRLPGQSYFGAEPVGLAASGGRLYVANLATDAVAVLDTRRLTTKAAKKGMVEPLGFLPTEWMPTSVAVANGRLFVATGKGHGTGPNNFPQRETESVKAIRRFHSPSTYIASLLYGSMAMIPVADVEAGLKASTEEVLVSNRMRAAEERITFAGGGDRIKHVIYIIKENRTYDQILGDLAMRGQPVGNGDKSLAMYGEAVTPNEHKLALQFGVLDNFFDSGEVSGDGHVWSNAAIDTDYLERTWEQNYRGGQRSYDFEGVVAEGYPLEQHIADVNEPASGYIWGNLTRHGKSLYHFGEYIASTFCNDKKTVVAPRQSQEGPMLTAEAACARKEVGPGEGIPAEWGGGVNKWPWALPLLAENKATKPELMGHFAPEAPDFALVSHSSYWDDTAIVALEDDAQAGADHVDAHRSIALVVSKYAPVSGDGDAPVVDSRFYSTVSVIRTMESLLGLPPMNNNDAFASLMSKEFSGPGTQAAFVADTRNRDNGLIYAANPKVTAAMEPMRAEGERESAKMDFRHEDHQDTQKLNVILWRDAMGDQAVPALLTEKRRKAKKDDDDD